jgi:transposase
VSVLAGEVRADVKERTGGTRANLDVLQRLERYTAREVFPLLLEALTAAEPDLVPTA